MLELFLFLSALAVVAKFSTVVVDSATKLSQVTGISRTVIGFAFIGVATSLPELSIAVISSLEKQGALSLGNVLGANIMNLTLILGFMAFIGFNLGSVYSQQLKRAIAIAAGIAFMLLFSSTAGFLFGAFLLSVYYLVFAALIRDGFVSAGNVSAFDAAKSAVKLLTSVFIVVAAAYVVTNSALLLASDIGISAPLIGATIISVGTTMPELSVNVAAVKKRNISLAVGDLIGTLVANLALVFGIAAMINPITISQDILSLAVISLLAYSVVYVLSRRMVFGLKESLLLISMYVLYILASFVMI